MRKFLTATIGFILFLCSSCQNNPSSISEEKLSSISEDSVMKIAREAYIFGYPLIMIDYTRRVATNVDSITPNGFAPINQISHRRSFPDHTFTEVVKPNCDTYYSSGFFDLKAEPIVLSVPATDRYYLLPLLDAWSNVFASPGTRTSGTGAGTFLLAGPSWKGQVPEGMQLIKSPTNIVWMIGRTQVNSAEDGRKVVAAIQDGYKAVPLSGFGKPYHPLKSNTEPTYAGMVPVEAVARLTVTEYFNEMAKLMVDNPPAAADSMIMKRLYAIGLEPGKAFSIDQLPASLQEKLNALPSLMQNAMNQLSNQGDPKQLVNGWKYMTEKVGEFGTDYMLRAGVAYGGLGANSPKDAVYPGTMVDINGELLHSDNKYVVHFEKTGIPPVNAFWSLTMYNAKDFLAENSIDRFTIGDRNKLTYNPDGSLDIFLQKNSPGKNKESNWLPTPQSGNFKITMRLYWPKEVVLNRSWQPPVVRKQ